MEIDNYVNEISQIEKEISNDSIQDRLQSIFSLINKYIEDYARQLQLEYSQYPLRFDVQKLTIIADKDDGPTYFENMGSAKNWIGYHIVTHLALHKWFSQKKRPVPNLIFFDQPSQAYYPPEKDIDGGKLGNLIDDDRENVHRYFKQMHEYVSNMSNKVQVIVTDHADINDDWFQECVIERWRGNEALIPEGWPDEKQTSKS